MATHGCSGVNRWLLGSFAENALRGIVNPLLLIYGWDSLHLCRERADWFCSFDNCRSARHAVIAHAKPSAFFAGLDLKD